MKLTFKREKCIGCHLCELACSASKEGVFNPAKARLHVDSYYREDEMIVQVSLCNMCMSCRNVCPTEAIISKNGYLAVNIDNCIKCGNCVEACPNSVLHLDENDFPRLCDLCEGAPHCVEWCPYGALAMEVANHV